MIGNIKRKFPPKTGLREKQVLQDPGYPRSMLHAAWYAAMLYKYYVEGVERNKIIINEYLRLHLRLLFVM